MKARLTGALLAIGLAVGTASAAKAAIILTPIETDAVSLQPTNIVNAPMTFNKFDSSLGTLQAVIITLTGNVEGTAKYESQDAAAATVTLQLSADISLSRPGGGSIVQTLPVANITDNPTAYDGVTDFGGTSGGTFTGLSASAYDSNTLTSASDLALFTAAFIGDTITLDLDASGASNGSGAGNLILQFITNAGATGTVQYAYDNGVTVPEPGMLAIFGVGLIGLGAVRRRQRKA